MPHYAIWLTGSNELIFCHLVTQIHWVLYVWVQFQFPPVLNDHSLALCDSLRVVFLFFFFFIPLFPSTAMVSSSVSTLALALHVEPQPVQQQAVVLAR